MVTPITTLERRLGMGLEFVPHPADVDFFERLGIGQEADPGKGNKDPYIIAEPGLHDETGPYSVFYTSVHAEKDGTRPGNTAVRFPALQSLATIIMDHVMDLFIEGLDYELNPTNVEDTTQHVTVRYSSTTQKAVARTFEQLRRKYDATPLEQAA